MINIFIGIETQTYISVFIKKCFTPSGLIFTREQLYSITADYLDQLYDEKITKIDFDKIGHNIGWYDNKCDTRVKIVLYLIFYHLTIILIQLLSKNIHKLFTKTV